MPPAPYAESLRRFARDLSALREAQGVPLDRIQQESRIPIHVLRDFEADALLGNPVFNRVYLRSLVKTYADALRLPVSEVLGALESAYSGEFTSLAYLGPSSMASPRTSEAARAPAAAPAPSPVVPPASGASGEREEARAAETAGDADAHAVPAGLPVAAAMADVPVDLVVPPADVPAAPPQPAARPAAAEAARPAPTERTPSAPPPVPRVLAPLTHAGQAFTSPYDASIDTRRVPGWLPAALGVVALVAVIGAILWWLGRDPSAEAGGASADSSAVAVAPPVRADSAAAPAAALPAPVALPDTLVLTVRATTESLRPIRIRRDDDVRRPYWIEAGEEQTFAFRDSAFVDAAAWPTAAYVLNGAPLDAAAVRAPDGTLVLVRSRLGRR